MPAYKENNGTWTSRITYRDWKGDKVQKVKRGFKKKSDALEYERDFKTRLMKSADIAFDALVENYLQDLVENEKIEITTSERKRNIFDTKITPYFKKTPVNKITELDILRWQSAIQQQGYDQKRTGFSKTYLKAINNELTAIFNYAMRYYKLPDNPCLKAGSMGKADADAMQIWTLDQFEQFIACCDKSGAKLAFDILFWSGIREGELLALTPAAILPTHKIIINKNRQRAKGETIIKDPKTENSIREVSIPQFLYDEILEYIDVTLGGLKEDELIFTFTKSFLINEIKRVAHKAGLDPIRVHDLRHSHASLLIEMGFNILLISDRLGHKNVQTTWKTYAHLYPDKGKQIAFGLDDVKVSGITENKYAEDHMLSLIGEIKDMLPVADYSKDDIYLWDAVEKVKELVDKNLFMDMVSNKMDSNEAYLIMLKEGYFVLDERYIFCFESKGLPIKYL